MTRSVMLHSDVRSSRDENCLRFVIESWDGVEHRLEQASAEDKQ